MIIFKSLTLIWLIHQSASNTRHRLLSDDFKSVIGKIINIDDPIRNSNGSVNEEVQNGIRIDKGIGEINKELVYKVNSQDGKGEYPYPYSYSNGD